MTCDADAESLRSYIRASTICYAAYKKWLVGDPRVRGFYMHTQKRDFELAAALYRNLRLKQLGIVA